MLNNETFSFIISLFGLISLELIIENCPWSDRNINYSSRLIKWKEKLSRLTLAIIHKICGNSHSRASKIQNFLRPPTMVANIFYIILASPSPPLLKWSRRACIGNNLTTWSKVFQTSNKKNYSAESLWRKLLEYPLGAEDLLSTLKIKEKELASWKLKKLKVHWTKLYRQNSNSSKLYG